jgi:hypothetical protein
MRSPQHGKTLLRGGAAAAVVGVCVAGALVLWLAPHSKHGAPDRASNVSDAQVKPSAAPPIAPAPTPGLKSATTKPVPAPLPVPHTDERRARLMKFFADALREGIDESVQVGSKINMEDPKGLEARMRTEPRDEVWASYTERELQDYLARQSFENIYDPADVECRTSLCRIMVVTDRQAYQSAITTTPSADWQVAIANLQHESIWGNFSETSDMMAINYKYPSHLEFVTFLRRR